MPAPIASAMQQLATLHFQSLGITLPIDWEDPEDGEASDQFGASFEEGHVTGNSPGGNALFQAASGNKLHADTVDDISEKIKTYMDGACAAICSAWSTWQSAASMSGVSVVGPIASAGSLSGPGLKSLILAEAPQANEAEQRYSKAIATAVDGAWASYVSSIKVPGLPWYPAFAAFPGPVAPPTPNIPCPVIVLTQVTSSVASRALKGDMVDELNDSEALHHAAIFESIATAFETCFTLWQTTTMVTQVLGTGSIPTFAPPVVPVGPVVGGTGTMAPGGLV